MTSVSTNYWTVWFKNQHPLSAIFTITILTTYHGHAGASHTRPGCQLSQQLLPLSWSQLGFSGEKFLKLLFSHHQGLHVIVCVVLPPEIWEWLGHLTTLNLVNLTFLMRHLAYLDCSSWIKEWNKTKEHWTKSQPWMCYGLLGHLIQLNLFSPIFKLFVILIQKPINNIHNSFNLWLINFVIFVSCWTLFIKP